METQDGVRRAVIDARGDRVAIARGNDALKYDLKELLQFKALIEQMWTIWNFVEVALDQLGPARVAQCLGNDSEWLKQYDMSAEDLAREVASIVGTGVELEQIIALTSEQDRIRGVKGLLPLGATVVELPGGIEPEFYGVALLAFQRARNYLMSLFVYGQHIYSLVQAARRGNESALMKAVSIDRMTVGLPEIQERIRRAELLRERPFLDALDKAMKGPSGHISRDYPLLRAFLSFAQESGLLGKLTQDERHKLFCEELALYDGKDEDRWAGVNRFVNRWQASLET